MARLKVLQVPESLEGCVLFLDKWSEFINEKSNRGDAVREAYSRVKEFSDGKIEKAKDDNPLAFLKVSYEQSVKLNAWIWGINFLVDFDANRIGKTAGSVFNALFWMYPNNPEYQVFKPYIDKWGRKVHVLQRPSIVHFLQLQDLLDKQPELRGDPLKGLDDPENARKFANLQKMAKWAFEPSWPEPSFTFKQNTMWLGAPDSDYHKNIIMPEWRKWMPKSIVIRDSTHEKTFSLDIDYTTKFGSRRKIRWEVICKSYESKDTKWSGAAVRAILLTEGLQKDVLNEIRQRFQSESFASWDFTPYEARNTGAKSALAHKVFHRKEELPLRYFVWSGYGIQQCPDFILPERKREDLIRTWKGSPQGQARIYGKFYSDSPQALSNLDREFHTLTWSKKELFANLQNGQLYRAFDPGYDHPSCCIWGLLSPSNEWFIYRIWSQSGMSIGERCRKIISLSGNQVAPYRFGTRPDDVIYKESNIYPESEQIIATVADHHLFKTDEITKSPYVNNYRREGLVLRPSTTMRPKDRANEVNRLLERSNFLKHPERKTTPGSRIYFLINEMGVAEGLEKLENLFWTRYLQGENMGMPKDALAEHGDDEFDALGYLTLSSFRWSANVRPLLYAA